MLTCDRLTRHRQASLCMYTVELSRSNVAATNCFPPFCPPGVFLHMQEFPAEEPGVYYNVSTLGEP